jgi:hypothetical protein
MRDFYSQTLDRTFDLVYFANGLISADISEKEGALPPSLLVAMLGIAGKTKYLLRFGIYSIAR